MVDTDEEMVYTSESEAEGEAEGGAESRPAPTPQTWERVAQMYEIMEASRDDVDAASFEGISLPSSLKQPLIKVLKAVQLVHKHKHNASAAGKQGEVARAKLKKGLIRVTDDEVKDLQEAWQEEGAGERRGWQQTRLANRDRWLL